MSRRMCFKVQNKAINFPIQNKTLGLYLHYVKRDYIYIGIILIVLGAGLFGAIGKGKQVRNLQREIKGYDKENKLLNSRIDSVETALADRNKVIEQSTIVFDSIQKKLIQLNDKKIVTDFPNHSVTSTLDLDGQILLLSNYLSQADSIAR